MKKDPIYITGHQHPDTDSVASAIAYAFFKKSLGIHAVPCCLGKLNGETKYLLSCFQFPEPQRLNDARIMLGEVPMDPPTYIHSDTTIYESLQQMQQGTGSFPSGLYQRPGKRFHPVFRRESDYLG